MILIIRISGLVEVNQDINETLDRLRLRRKYSAVLVKNTKEMQSILQKIRNFVAYGEVSKEDILALIEKRGQPIKGKINLADVATNIDKKSLTDLGLKEFFRLHPPRGGIDSKLHFGVKHGVLGDNGKDISKLLRRML